MICVLVVHKMYEKFTGNLKAKSCSINHNMSLASYAKVSPPGNSRRCTRVSNRAKWSQHRYTRQRFNDFNSAK